MKWVGTDFIIHGLFVDDMEHTSTSKILMDEFMKAYSHDFEITVGEIMSSFLGLASHVTNPGPAHWAALHHLMEYLDNYPSFKLVYRQGSTTGKELDAFADSD